MRLDCEGGGGGGTMRPIFCGNFDDYDTRQVDLERLFSKYGPIRRIDMKPGLAFIYFEDERDAEDAIRMLDGVVFGSGRRLCVEWSRRVEPASVNHDRPTGDVNPMGALFVTNIDPVRTKAKDIRRHFEPYGRIIYIQIHRDCELRPHRVRNAFALVQYNTQEEASAAVKQTDKSTILDRVVTVGYAFHYDDNEKDRRCAMPDPVAAASRFFAPSWVLLESTAYIGEHRWNNTTAAGLTSARRPIQVSFMLADPPEVTRWYVHGQSLKKKWFHRYPAIIATADSLVVLCITFRHGNRYCKDYFVYRAGPGKPSLDLIPRPYPKIASRFPVGILPRAAGEHYSVVFPIPRLDSPKACECDMHIFSSDNQAWNIRASPSYDHMRMYCPTKVVVVGESSLAWIDTWRGVLLYNVLNENPTVQLIQWPYPAPCEVQWRNITRDATISNDKIRFVHQEFRGNRERVNSRGHNNWTVTIWEKNISLNSCWEKLFRVDVAGLLLPAVLDLNKVLFPFPFLSPSDKSIVFFSVLMEPHEVLLISINARDARLEAVGQKYFYMNCSPSTFSRFLDTSEGADMASQSEDFRRTLNQDSLTLLQMPVLCAEDRVAQIAAFVANYMLNYHQRGALLNTTPVPCSYANVEKGVNARKW